MSASPTRPAVDFTNWQGLYTKPNPNIVNASQLRVCENCDYVEEYGALAKIRGTKALLNQQYTELDGLNSVVRPLSWVGFYKAQDYSGQFRRHTLVSAGTTIQRREPDGTLTELGTGEPLDLFRTSAQDEKFLYLTSQDPYSVGKKGTPRKYDGENLLRWGLLAPGSEETVLDSFSSASGFTPIGASLADETIITFSGDSVKTTKTTTTQKNFGLEKLNQASFSINNIIEDRTGVRVFISEAAYRKLSTSGRVVSIYIGSDGDLNDNYYRYDFQVGELRAGWNLLLLDFSTFPSGLFGETFGTPDDNNLKSYRFEVLTENASDSNVDVYWDDFIKYDQGGAVPVFAGVGSTFGSGGVWSYKITYVNEYGFESNAGPISVEADNTSGGQDFGQINLTQVPISSDPSTIARNIYRTVRNGTEWNFVGTINNNVDDTFIDTVADTGLGVLNPPEIADRFDHSIPPNCGIHAIHKRTGFLAGDPLNPATLYFSEFDLLDAYPILNAFEFDSPITGMFETYLGLVITTETDTWQLYGDNPDFFIDKAIKKIGAMGPRAVGEARIDGWMWDEDGVRLYDLSNTIKISEPVRDIFENFSKKNRNLSHSVHFRSKNAMIFAAPDSDGVYRNLMQYQYPIDDTRNGWFSKIVLPTSNGDVFDFQHMAEVEDENGEFHLYVADKFGMLYELFADDALNWNRVSGGPLPIVQKIAPAFLRLGALGVEVFGATGRATPYSVEVRINPIEGQEVNIKVLLESSDGSTDTSKIRGSQEMHFVFPDGIDLQRDPTTNFQGAEFLRFTLINEDLNVDLTILGIRIDIDVQEGQYLVQSSIPGGQA